MINNCIQYNDHKNNENYWLLPIAEKLHTQILKQLEDHDVAISGLDAELEAEANAPKLERNYRTLSGAAALSKGGMAVGNAVARSKGKAKAQSAAAASSSAAAASAATA